ncbi:MAG TPA: FUSC family protein [Streptosporangiaceae bacterium]|nr:FUSC family protein [Streptosporangiaceae bacterium]
MSNQVQRPGSRDVREAVLDSALLAVASLASYWLVADLLSGIHTGSRTEHIIGGLWAAIATIFVSKSSYQQSVAAAVSRVAGTLVSFALCFVYLVFLPVHLWAFALLIGVSALAPTLAGRPADAATAAITTAVLLALAALDPHHAWLQPILRLGDTVVGVIVGVAAARVGRKLTGQRAPSDP